MESAASALIAAVLKDPTATSVTKQYQFARLCSESSQAPSIPSPCQHDLPAFAAQFCKKLSSVQEGGGVESDASLCEWWQQESLRSAEQANHRRVVRETMKHLLSKALEFDAKELEDDLDTSATGCMECNAAMQEAAQELIDPTSFPPAPRKIRPVNLSALVAPVTTQEVQKALKHIVDHGSLSKEMRCEASRILDCQSAVNNFAIAIGAVLESAGRLWEWGEAAALAPHRHAVHGLKKCRVFSEPSSVLMLAFLEVFSKRLLPEVSKSLNPLQRWRHKHEVRRSAIKVRQALARDRNAAHSLQLRVERLQQARLQLRQRFDFPLSQAFCYEGNGEGFGKMFRALRVEVELCKFCFCNMQPSLALEKEERESGSEDCGDSDDRKPGGLDFEFVGESLTVFKCDLQNCCKTIPHTLILHCLKALGLDADWCAFFSSYLQTPHPSGKCQKRGMPLGPSLSTLLLEIVGCFLDLWLHRGFLQSSKWANEAGAVVESSMHTDAVLASLRCGDDTWFIARSASAENVWTRVKDLYRSCGLSLNLEDCGSIALGDAATANTLDVELPQPPCWSLLQLTPDCSWAVARWRLEPRVKRAMAEIQAEPLSIFTSSNPAFQQAH